jgi:hypothetical protein
MNTENNAMKKRFSMLAIAPLALAGVCFYFFLFGCPWPYEHKIVTPTEIVTIKEEGIPMQIDAFVVDAKGNPVKGVWVGIRNGSGHDAGQTDDKGYAKITSGARELDEISITEETELGMRHETLYKNERTISDILFGLNLSIERGVTIRIQKL